MTDLLQRQELIYLAYIGVAIGVFLLFTGLAQLISRRENRSEAKSRRIRMLERGASKAELLALFKPPKRVGLLSRLPFFDDFSTSLIQAGWRIKPQLFLMICSLITFLVFVFAGTVTSVLNAGLLALAFGYLIPLLTLKSRCTARSEMLVHQLPDALDLLARGLKVGHPLNTSVGAVAEEMADPIGTEFGIIFDQVSYGEDLTDAFADFANRVRLEDVQYLSASIGIQHGTGGDLARVIAILSKVIRDRIALRRKIRAISSEGRLTAWFLSSLPLVIYFGTTWLTPDYYGGVTTDPLFLPMAAVVIGFTIINALVLHKLVRFRI